MEDSKHFRHISDIDVWLTPDRNYFIFILLSVFFGFFALDHIYLRSFDTAFQKILYNFFGLGFWYFWDLIQIFTDGTKVSKDGLNGPFDWIQGIGRGVFAHGAEKDNDFVPKKSYIIWAFLAIFGGFFALDKFYLGNYWHGVLKLFSVFSIFILFGVFWVAWDAFHAFFMTKDVLSGKISLPFPVNLFGLGETDGTIFLPQKSEGGGGLFSWIPVGNPMFGKTIENVGPNTVTPAVRIGLGSMVQSTLEKAAGKEGAQSLTTLGTSISAALPTHPPALPPAAATAATPKT
jgi:TM2 domain-containing membrane protein YozV